jgi:tetratricopeptide (TPR) repeat protein
VEQFEQVVQKDETFALAWAGLALAVNLFPLYVSGEHDPPDVDAEHAARRAIELDPTLAEAHTALGYLQDPPEGTTRLRHAVDLKPSYAQAHQWLGLKLLVTGDVEAAREHASIATELEPRNRAVRGFRAFQHIVEGQYQKGLAIIEQNAKGDEVEPGWTMHTGFRFVFAALYALGEWTQANGIVQQRLGDASAPRWEALWTAKQGMVEAALENREAARQGLQGLRGPSADLHRGILLFALGQEEAGSEALRNVQTWGYYDVIELRYFYPELLADFRQTERYETLLSMVENRWANPTTAYWHHAE